MEASAKVRSCLLRLYEEEVTSAVLIDETLAAFQQLFAILSSSKSSPVQSVKTWALGELYKLIDFLLREYFTGDLNRVYILQSVLACWRTHGQFQLAENADTAWSHQEKAVLEALRSWTKWAADQKYSLQESTAYVSVLSGMLAAFQDLTIIGYRCIADAGDETNSTPLDTLLTMLQHLPLPSAKKSSPKLVAGLSAAVSLADAHQGAVASLAFSPRLQKKQACRLAALLDSRRLRDLPAPALFAPVFLGVLQDEDVSLETRVTATGGLFDLMVEHRLGVAEKLVGAFYELLRPELFAIAEREKALSCLMLLSKALSKVEAVFFIKRALRLAALVPPHASLWLIAFAKVIFGRHSAFCLPLIQFDAEVQPESADICASLPTGLGEMEEDSTSESDILQTNAAVARYALRELELLQRHACKNIAASSAALHTEVFDPERKLQAKEELQTILQISALDISNKACHNTLSRCVKGTLGVALDCSGG